MRRIHRKDEIGFHYPNNRPPALGIWACHFLVLFYSFFCINFYPCQVLANEGSVRIHSSTNQTSENTIVAALATDKKDNKSFPSDRRANFQKEHKSREAQRVADWVVHSGDNQGMPFAVVDKTEAKVFVFNAEGHLRGAAPVLIGLSRGDEAVPGIGNKRLSDIRPEERTTPAGRFVAFLGFNARGKDVLWVDYEGAVSLHRVVTAKPAERRLERLATPTPLDNRISYGCINVPAKFFDSVVKPVFSGIKGVVYVLPEIRSPKEVFASYYEIE